MELTAFRVLLQLPLLLGVLVAGIRTKDRSSSLTDSSLHQQNYIADSQGNASFPSGWNFPWLRSAVSGPPVPLFWTEKDVATYPLSDKLSPCLADSIKSEVLPQRKSHKTCAVVGRAPNTAGANAAVRIDSHEKVFRAGLCGYETARVRADVGSKTDYCVSFWDKHMKKMVIPLKAWNFLQSFHETPNCQSRYLFTHPSYLKMLDSEMEAMSGSSERPANEWREGSIFYDPVCSLKGNTEKPTESDGCRKVINLSSGYVAVRLAMDLCESVTLFGFDLDTRLDAPYGHVDGGDADGRRFVEEHPHAFPLERSIFKQFNSAGKLKFDQSMTATDEAHWLLFTANTTSSADANMTNSSIYSFPW